MGIEAIIGFTIRTLEEGGFDGRVFQYDFAKLDDPSIPSMILIELGRMSGEEIDTYGNNWARKWTIHANIFQSLQDHSAEEAHSLLMQDIDKFLIAIETRIHLGEGGEVDIRQAKVLNVDQPVVLSTEGDVQNWLRTIARFTVDETESHEGTAGVE